MRHWTHLLRAIPCLLLCLFAGSSWAPAVWSQEPDRLRLQENTLTLDQAIHLALQKNRPVQNSRISAKIADVRLSAAKINYLPRLSLSATGAYIPTPLDFNIKKDFISDKVPQQDMSFRMDTNFVAPIIAGLQQPLSDLYRIHLDVQGQKAGTDIAHEACREQRQQLILDVQVAYFTVLTNQSELEAMESDIAFYESLLNVVEQRLKVHEALEVDVLNVSKELASARHTKLVLRNAIEEAKEQMNSLTGRDVLAPLYVTDVPVPTLPTIDMQAAGTKALELRPEMRQARLQMKQAKLAYQSERLQDLPKLNFQVLSISILNVPVIPEEIALLGVSMSWDFFDWGRPLKEIQEKKLALEQAVNTASQTESDILLNVNRTSRNIEEARSRIEVAEISEKADKAQLQIVKAQYNNGEALLKDVLDAQSDYEEARQMRRQAVLSYLTARADYMRALGVDGVWDEEPQSGP